MMTLPRETCMTPSGEVLDEIAKAIGRIRFGSVVVQIQDGVVVQIESTEKKRFQAAPPGARAPR